MRLMVLAALGLLAFGGTAHANLIQNGSFESGTDPGVFTTVTPGQTSITGWTVGGTSVDYIGTYWQPEDGSRSIDLAGLGPGSLSQSFSEVKGQQYLITFYLAGNPDGAPTTKTASLAVDVGGANYSYQTQGVTTRNNMGWEQYSFTFTASATGSTLLTFASTVAGPYGMALDNVNVSTVPLPASLPLFGLALLGIGGLAFFRNRKSQANSSFFGVAAA